MKIKLLNIEKISWKLNKIEIFTDQLKQEKLLNFEGAIVYCSDEFVNDTKFISKVVVSTKEVSNLYSAYG